MESNKVHTITGPNPDGIELETTGPITVGSKSQVEDLMTVVKTRTTAYDPTLVVVEEGGREFIGEETGFCHLIFKYANGCDKCTFIFATICAVLFSSALPGFCVLFGLMLDGVGGSNTFDSLGDQALYMVYLGVFSFVMSSNLIVWHSSFAINISH